MNSLRMGIDGVSQATPLDTFKTSLHAGHPALRRLMQASIFRRLRWRVSGWQWVNLAWLAGGACCCCGKRLFAGTFR
jgi:electron transport complex protein RnfD